MIDRDGLLRKLVSIQYTRNDVALARGTFRVRGDTLEILPAYADTAFRLVLFGDELEHLQHFDPLTGEVIATPRARRHLPATHYNVREGMIDDARRRDRRASSTSAARSSRRRASCWSLTACASAPTTTWSAARGRLLQRHRELLADPRRPRSPANARIACSTTSPTTSSASSTSPTRRCRRSGACTRATAPASRRSSTTASACRARSTTARRPSRSFCRSHRRSCSSPRLRASTSARTRHGSSSRSCARRGSSTPRSRSAKRGMRSTT